MHSAPSPSSQATPSPFTASHASPESSLSGSLPPIPLESRPLDTSCFDTAWDVSKPPLSHTLSERRGILKEDGLGEAPTDIQVQKATAIAHRLNPLECRARIVELLRWQNSTTPEVPLHLLSQRIDGEVLNESRSLSFLPENASRIVSSGFVGEDMAKASLVDLQRDLVTSNPISRTSSVILLAVTGVAYCALHPLAAIGPAFATVLALQQYDAASWARREYSIGYLRETFDAYRALSRGESPTIAEGIAKHFKWERNERYRADGYMVARTLRILGVASAAIHEAYATTASVDFRDQPLVNLLLEKLETIGVSTSGCLAVDYLEAKGKGGDLAKVIDALNSCYFLWGKRSARLSQHKMIELLTKR